MPSLRVLVLEDSEDDALLMLQQLRSHWTDLVAERVETRQGFAAALARPWDLLLADFQLPSFTAADALEMVKERDVDLPFVIVSGRIGDEAAAALMRAGAHDFLRKEKLSRLVPVVERELEVAAARREHRAAVARLEQSEKLFRRMVETAHGGVWLLDAAERTIYVNRRMAEMLGVTAADAEGTTVYSFLDEAMRARAAPNLERRRAGISDSNEFRFRRRDGSEFWALVSSSPMTDDEGRYTGALAFVSDISEQKGMQEQLMIADRMVSVGTLAAGVAHEINNPVAAVIANLDLALEKLAAAGEAEPLPSGDLRDGIAEAREAADRVRQIARDLILFSRSAEERRSAVDVEEVLESSLRIARNEILHRARLVRDYRPVPRAAANASRLGQVFLNLIVNAAQAIEEGRAGDNEIRVATGITPDGRVLVRIGDSGGGIPAEHQERIFSPFFTTKPKGVGTGLGLAICKRIVESFGGEIGFDSTPGSGSEFRVVLPAAPAEAVAAPAPEPRPATPTRRCRILVVDDEPMIGKVIQRVLEREHDVEVATHAREALATVASGTAFDLILCDLMMPEMTGMDLHAALQRADPEQAARMVFLTGGAFTPRARLFLDGVGDRRIDKPFDLATLRTRVNRYLAA
jgi:PAS domain S-box-containing protein